MPNYSAYFEPEVPGGSHVTSLGAQIGRKGPPSLGASSQAPFPHTGPTTIRVIFVHSVITIKVLVKSSLHATLYAQSFM